MRATASPRHLSESGSGMQVEPLPQGDDGSVMCAEAMLSPSMLVSRIASVANEGGIVTSRRCGQGIAISRGSVSKVPRGLRVVLSGAALAVCLATTQVASAFLQGQVPDDPSPESGSAQVVAQGVVSVQDGDVRWQITERTAPPPANASASTSEVGFLIVDSGVLLAENLSTGDQQRLPAGEAMLTMSGDEHIRAALGSDPAAYRDLALVDAAAEAPVDGTVVFTGEPFAGSGARHDIDLLQDALAPGGTMAIPAGALPTLVLILDGVAEIANETGDVFSLGAGEAVSLSGPLVVTATENGAGVAAAFAGPTVPRLAEAAGTPVPGGRVIQTPGAQTPEADEAPPAATAIIEQPAVDDADDDGDGLTNAEEVDPGTDPNLADTDEDGLTDGQEVLEIGTLPLTADSDGDGVLDGDEVAQGTDPLDGIAAAAAGDEAPVDEPVAVEEPAPVDPSGVPGDIDGDGLEDTIEAELGTDPFDLDTDDDGLTDGAEYYVNQTGTRNPDSDGDGVTDGVEIANGTDPNDPASF